MAKQRDMRQLIEETVKNICASEKEQYERDEREVWGPEGERYRRDSGQDAFRHAVYRALSGYPLPEVQTIDQLRAAAEWLGGEGAPFVIKLHEGTRQDMLLGTIEMNNRVVAHIFEDGLMVFDSEATLEDRHVLVKYWNHWVKQRAFAGRSEAAVLERTGVPWRSLAEKFIRSVVYPVAVELNLVWDGSILVLCSEGFCLPAGGPLRGSEVQSARKEQRSGESVNERLQVQERGDGKLALIPVEGPLYVLPHKVEAGKEYQFQLPPATAGYWNVCLVDPRGQLVRLVRNLPAEWGSVVRQPIIFSPEDPPGEYLLVVGVTKGQAGGAWPEDAGSARPVAGYAIVLRM